MKNKLFRIWRFLLPFLFIFFLIHFLKDITQDILRINTPLNIFGDIKENLSFLPSSLQNVYLYGLGGLSFIAEAFILYAIPTILKRKDGSVYYTVYLVSENKDFLKKYPKKPAMKVEYVDTKGRKVEL